MANSTEKAKKRKPFRFGPGALVTAAFIGPGTITACSIAGASFGYTLLWGLVFSVIATIVLQEMASRLGIISRQGLGEALRNHFNKPVTKFLTALLIISAITIGNAAFETGNLLGASIGLKLLFPELKIPIGFWAASVGIIAAAILFTGSYKIIERFLIGLVILMSLTFLTTAFVVNPEISAVFKGMFIPAFPNGSLLTIAGLIGTTVVPYNLFLHASAVQERWKDADDLSESRKDIFVSVILGGFISMAIVVTSAAAFFGINGTISSGADLAVQLEPLLGSYAKYFIGTGLFAAGISSAITAPLAAAYATVGILGWKKDMKSLRFRLVWISIIGIGIVFSMFGFRPIEAILFAQTANGILLPVIAIYLLWVMNSPQIMGANVNNRKTNLLGGVVVLIAFGLGIRSLLHVFGLI